MSAGTLTVTNGSDVVKGNGTAFTSMKSGDFIVFVVGGAAYTLPVNEIASDEELTLVAKYTGPTQSGLAWYDVPREAQSMVTAALVAQSAEALRGLNIDKANWQQIFSSSTDITITMPDGREFSGPSWRKVVDMLNALDLEQAQQIADQMAKAQQAVAADKATVAQDRQAVEGLTGQADDAAKAAEASAKEAATRASTASQKATDAAAEAARAEQAADDAENRGAAQVGFATAQADRAKEEADRAAAANPANSLLKAQNLADVEDKAQALQNLLDEKPLPLLAPAVNQNEAPTLQQVQNLVGMGSTGPTQTGVMNYGVGDFHLRDSRLFVQPYEVTSDGQLLNRADYPDLWAYAQLVGAISDENWLGYVENRTLYSTGDGETTFRVPDRNGVQQNGVNGFTGVDSIKNLYGRGDGGQSAVNGRAQEGGVPNITGGFWAYGYDQSTGGNNGAFAWSNGGNNVFQLDSTTSSKTKYESFSFDASRSSKFYKGISEVRPNSFFGVWVIRASGAFVAANTSYAVMNAYSADQPANSLLEGGRVQSEIRVAGVLSAKAALVVKQRVGGDTTAAIEITDSSGPAQKVATINILATDGATVVTNTASGYVSAWVLFDGRSSAANSSLPITSSHNESSVSYLGGGIYQVNFGRPMADVNYGVLGMTSHPSPDNSGTVIEEIGTRSVNGVRLVTRISDTGAKWANSPAITVAILGKGTV